ncbi:MAG: isoleucine--tRNA ligase [bacterium]|nr:isoleucine--tRNA ligase [bacterium]
MYELLKKRSVKASEDEINQYWEEIDILNKILEKTKGLPNFVFYDGPPTANGMPGIHHVVARNLKDTICKYKTMRGYNVLRKAGWDTHGLPVEIEVEKELGLSDKKQIEKYGVLKFNQKCRESVFKYKSAWEKMTKEMGYFIDMNNPYVTYDNNYIETVWWILNKFFNEGLIYEGHKILPFCTRCGTGLASHEVAQGYKQVKVTSVMVPMKLVDEDTYLLVWTTTPWTLLCNVAVCVNPDEKYVKLRSKDTNFIVGKKLVDKIFSDYEILDEYKGSDLEYREYQQLLTFAKPSGKNFYIVNDNYVSMEDGTGLVHIAPAFGQDDYDIGLKYKLDVLNIVDENGKYTTGPWSGKSVLEVDDEIILYLKEQGKLFKKEKIVHNYPHCWRCNTPLLYYAKPSWYIKMTALKDKLIKNNNTVNWYPDFVGEKRFGNWLENLNDWAISRNRYWGTPLNIWRCECGHIVSVGSIAELRDKAIEEISENIDLHRPFVDDVHIKCDKCNGVMNRVKEVIDCWFDSGSMPFAQFHYPFENKRLFNNQFPADYICEGIDQTRGWFYSLLAISTFVTGVSPYKNVLVPDLLLDKNGQKMSKSRGNGVDPFALFNEFGADILRWYLLYTSLVWAPTKFDIEGLREVQSKFFGTLKNTYLFFAMYANVDSIDASTLKLEYNELEDIDKWIISKFNNLVKDVINKFEEYDLTKVVHLITDFVSDDLSNWYIRRNRRRFWESELNNSKKGVYKTTYTILVDLCKLIAPICGFLAEELYRNLTGEVSVHLSSFPNFNNKFIDKKLESRMDLVIDLISLGRNAREDARIKIRQPIKEIILDKKYEHIIGDMDVLIKEELNVKNISYVKNISKYMNITYKPNYREVGKIFGSDIKYYAKYLENISAKDVDLLHNNKLKISINDKDYEVNSDMVEEKISAKDNYNIGHYGELFVILNTDIDKDLYDEGLAREFVSKIQNIRKNNDYNISDRIKIYYEATKDFSDSIDKHICFIKQETLCEIIEVKDNIEDKYFINEYEVGILLERVE